MKIILRIIIFVLCILGFGLYIWGFGNISNNYNERLEQKIEFCQSKDLIYMGDEGQVVKCVNENGEIKFFSKKTVLNSEVQKR